MKLEPTALRAASAAGADVGAPHSVPGQHSPPHVMRDMPRFLRRAVPATWWALGWALCNTGIRSGVRASRARWCRRVFWRQRLSHRRRFTGGAMSPPVFARHRGPGSRRRHPSGGRVVIRAHLQPCGEVLLHPLRDEQVQRPLADLGQVTARDLMAQQVTRLLEFVLQPLTRRELHAIPLPAERAHFRAARPRRRDRPDTMAAYRLGSTRRSAGWDRSADHSPRCDLRNSDRSILENLRADTCRRE